MDELGGNFADETNEMTPESAANASTELRKRRSTRIVQAVPLLVTGVDALGRPFTERTSTLIINCHGCRYQSKHYVLKNMWVTLEIPHPESGQPARSVRGRVAWIQRPRTVRQLFQVALEIEVPGNAWGIAFPPEDWFVLPELSSHHAQHPGVHGIMEPMQPSETAPSGTTEIHLPLSEPELPAAMGADNVRVFPSPASTTDAALQLGRQVTRLVTEAKQQINATAKEAVAQAAAMEQRAAFEQWEQKFAAARAEVTNEASRAIEKIQREAEGHARAALAAAARALQSELPVWLAPQLEQLTHELTSKLSQEGVAQRAEHSQQLANAVDDLRELCQRAEQTAERLKSQAEQTEAQITERTEAATRKAEEDARQREETIAAQQDSFNISAHDIEQQVTTALQVSQSSWHAHLASEIETAQSRWQSVMEGTFAAAQERAAGGLIEHGRALSGQLQEEISRHASSLHDSTAKTVSEAEQRLAGLRDAAHEQLERAEAAQQGVSSGLAEQARSLTAQLQEEAARHAAALHDSAAATIAEAEQGLAMLRDTVQGHRECIEVVQQGAAGGLVAQAQALSAQMEEEVARHAATIEETISSASAETEKRLFHLRNELQEQAQNLEAQIVRAAGSAERIEHFPSRIESARQQALGGFQSQLDDVLSVHRNELHRRSEALFAEINERIRASFENTSQEAAASFEQRVSGMIQPHISQSEEAIHRLAGGRALLEAALSLQQDRIRSTADEAFAESLARFRENLGGVEQILQDSSESITSRNLAELEEKIADTKHHAIEDLMKSSEWYEKKAQTQIQHATEKAIEQTSSQLREKAGEVSSVFASEIDHSSRSFIGHTQTQMEEVLRESFERSQALFAEAADTTAAAFIDEIQRTARHELGGFSEELQRSAGEARAQMDSARAEHSRRVSVEQEAFLNRFQEAIQGVVETGVGDAYQRVQGGLSPLLESWKTMTEAHQVEMRGIYTQISEQTAEQYRNRLENVSNQWMLATVASLDHQSRDLVSGIAANAEERLREACTQVFAGIGDTLRDRLQEIAASFNPQPPADPSPLAKSAKSGS